MDFIPAGIEGAMDHPGLGPRSIELKVQLPWKVRVGSLHAGVTRRRNGTLTRTTNIYFETKEAALSACPGSRPIYVPGEAWRLRNTERPK